MTTNYRVPKGLARAAVALGAAEFAVRAVARIRTDWLSDLAVPYLSAKLWLHGADPYNPSIALPLWYSSGASSVPNTGIAGAVYSVYPPPTLVFMAPLAVFRWHAAVYLFAAIGLLLYCAVVYGLVRFGWPQHRTISGLLQDPAAMLFVAFALGFAPVHTAFHSLNIVLFSCCAAILAVVFLLRARPPSSAHSESAASGSSITTFSAGKSRRPAVGLLVVAGVVAAILIKPTTGIFLLPWLVWERRWRWLTAVLATCAVVSALSLGLLLTHQGMSWLPNYKNNVTALFTHGGNADVSAENPDNTDRIDLQLVAFAVLGDRTLASAVATGVYLCLLLAFLRRAGSRQDSFPRKADAGDHPLDLPLLVASGCLALGLLPSYSREYSAIVLLPLVLWCFRHLRFRSARWLLLLLSDFLLNSSAMVRMAAEPTGVISRIPRLWDATIGGHTCWILLAIGCLLVYAAHQQTGEDVQRSVDLHAAL